MAVSSNGYSAGEIADVVYDSLVKRIEEGDLKSKKTSAPAELLEFVQRCKAMRMRQGKGEFVASDGTRMPYDFVFERDEKPARKGDDE